MEATSDAAARAVQATPWLERVPSGSVPPSIAAWDLGAGEASVIATALGMAPAGVLIDDLLGRRCALAHGLPVVGTLGLVVRAHRLGAVDDPRRVIAQLRDAGMWLSDSVITRAFRLAGIDP